MTGQKTVQNQRKRISFLLHTAALPWDGSFTSIASDMDELHQRALANLLYETDTDVAVVSDETSIGNVANATGVSGRLFAGDIFRESSYNINIPGASNKNLMRLTRTAKIQA